LIQSDYRSDSVNVFFSFFGTTDIKSLHVVAVWLARCYLSWKFTTIRRPFFAIFRENFTQTKQSCFGYLSWKFTTIRRPFFAIFSWRCTNSKQGAQSAIQSLPEINLNIKLKLTLTLFLTLTDTGGADRIGLQKFYTFIGTLEKSLLQEMIQINGLNRRSNCLINNQIAEKNYRDRGVKHGVWVG